MNPLGAVYITSLIKITYKETLLGSFTRVMIILVKNGVVKRILDFRAKQPPGPADILLDLPGQRLAVRECADGPQSGQKTSSMSRP